MVVCGAGGEPRPPPVSTDNDADAWLLSRLARAATTALLAPTLVAVANIAAVGVSICILACGQGGNGGEFVTDRHGHGRPSSVVRTPAPAQT